MVKIGEEVAQMQSSEQDRVDKLKWQQMSPKKRYFGFCLAHLLVFMVIFAANWPLLSDWGAFCAILSAAGISLLGRNMAYDEGYAMGVAETELLVLKQRPISVRSGTFNTQ